MEVGESYEEAAARELSEELGVQGYPRFVFKFRCAGAISPYWLGLHQVVVQGPVRPDASEAAWHAREAFDRYCSPPGADGRLRP